MLVFLAGTPSSLSGVWSCTGVLVAVGVLNLLSVGGVGGFPIIRGGERIEGVWIPTESQGTRLVSRDGADVFNVPSYKQVHTFHSTLDYYWVTKNGTHKIFTLPI